MAEELVKRLSEIASDFDKSKPMAAIETARTVSAMHLAKARNAAVAGDRATLEAEIRSATEIWPRNPDLAKVFGSISQQGDIQQQALVDLERLIAQKNFRQVYEDRVRFIAATALYPDKQAKLVEVLEKMTSIESALMRAEEVAKRGDAAGAWESVEKAFLQFPEDNKLNQARADYTMKASDFVRSLRIAEEQEKNGAIGTSLAWYLKAKKLYPPSEYAAEGIRRNIAKITPDAALGNSDITR